MLLFLLKAATRCAYIIAITKSVPKMFAAQIYRKNGKARNDNQAKRDNLADTRNTSGIHYEPGSVCHIPRNKYRAFKSGNDSFAAKTSYYVYQQ